MALVPYSVVALAESDADGTNGKNIVAGAVVTALDADSNVATMYDDATGANPSTAKTTNANGQVVIYLEPGDYTLGVNGVNTEISLGRFDGTTQSLISSVRSVRSGDSFTTSGFYTKGDEGGAEWQFTGATGLTPSQSPADLGEAKLTDANGNEFKLITNSPPVNAKATGATTGDATEAIDALLASFDDVWVGEEYSVTSLSNYDIGKRIHGTGIIKASSEFQTPYYGNTLVAGVKRGSTVPIDTQGGVLVGGSGETKNGVMLKAQNEGIVDVVPTRNGVPLEFQLYSNALQGYGDFTGTQFDAIARSGSFLTDAYPNDIIWFGQTKYRVDTITDADTLSIKNADGTPASAPTDTSLPYWLMYHHSEHTADLVGGVLTITGGDELQDWGEDHNFIINGVRYDSSDINTTNDTVTLASPPPDDSGIMVLHRWYSSEDYISIHRWQALRGAGREMTLSQFVRPDFAGMRIGASGSGSDPYAYYLPYHILTGRSAEKEQIPGEDNMEGEGYTAFTVKPDGKIGIGNRNPTSPLDVHWNYFNVAGEDNVEKEVFTARSSWAGAAERRVSFLHRNNYRAGIQAYDSGINPNPICIQPKGEGVTVGSWDAPTAGCTMDVKGGDLKVGDGTWNGEHLRMGNYHLWIDSTGSLRVKNGAPTSDTDGALV